MSYRDAVLSTNPVGYWRLGEASGTVAVDVMGLNNGTYVNAPTLGAAGLLTGDPDTAVTFASGKYMSVAQQVLPAAITLAGWVKATTWVDSAILGQWASSVGVMLYCDSVWIYLASQGSFTTKALVPSTGAVHFLVVTQDASGNGALYFDGLSVSNNAGLSAISSPAVPFEIGTYSNHAGGQFNGTIDEPAIWNRDLTAAEGAMLYAEGLADLSYHLAPLWFGDGTQEPWQGSSAKRYDNLPPTPDRG
jgi:hypothetical protein